MVVSFICCTLPTCMLAYARWSFLQSLSWSLWRHWGDFRNLSALLTYMNINQAQKCQECSAMVAATTTARYWFDGSPTSAGLQPDGPFVQRVVTTCHNWVAFRSKNMLSESIWEQMQRLCSHAWPCFRPSWLGWAVALVAWLDDPLAVKLQQKKSRAEGDFAWGSEGCLCPWMIDWFRRALQSEGRAINWCILPLAASAPQDLPKNPKGTPGILQHLAISCHVHVEACTAVFVLWIRLSVELMKQGSKLPWPVRAAEARPCLNRNLCVFGQ